ncbi:MAG: extracellular solute-binding protein [Tepidamorphaceae bacterium]|nr:ABC transporter substrate-binding protein [Rhodobiaceae bacterium]MCC0049956.1 ABC transporter substrate-binding protein [Rhodobiaceae bacterium]
MTFFSGIFTRNWRIATVAAAFLAIVCGAAQAQGDEWRHGLSLFGKLKYPAGFSHYDYVNPDAPKGGTFRRATIGTFDTLNPFNIKGNPAALSSAIYDTLLADAADEPSSEYGLLAEAVKYPDDFSSVTFKLRENARWHDGTPVTVDDVVWSLSALKEAHPFYNAYYRNVTGAVVSAPNEVTFTFDQTGNRELPLIVGQMPVLPKAYWESTGKDGTPRDFKASTLEPPMGSGPYRFGEIQPGRSVSFERVEDYWGKDVPVNVGQNNFDRLTVEYFRDLNVMVEAFKADSFDFHMENSAKRWATEYGFPAVKRGDVITETFQTKQAEPMQAFVFNTRLKKFADPRVRQAFNYAFDFEWMNENVFFDQYKRTESYFQNSELQATGLPGPKELELLEPLRDKIPPEVFTEEYHNPVGGGPKAMRGNLREAKKLLEEAGWTIQDRVLKNADGETMTLEFLTVSPDSERIIAPYIQSLERLGIKGTIRVVDSSQYQARTDGFDFEVITGQFAQSLSPGNEQRDYWSSASADRRGSRNLIGIKDEAVDTLVEAIVFAKDRETLVAACKALDRVLLWNHYVVPQFYSPDIRTARWNRFSRPETMPDYRFTTDTWWWDAEKAGSIKGAD